MSKKKRKEAGKIVAKKRSKRVRISLPRIRWDIVIIVVVVALIATASVIALTHRGGGKPHHKLSVNDLANYLAELSRGNTTIALDLVYEVRGEIPVGSEVLGVKDLLQVDVRYYEFELAIPKNKTSTNTTHVNATKKIHGYLVFYYGLDYIPILNSILGMSPSTNNLSRVLVDEEYIMNTTGGKARIINEGYENITLDDLGSMKVVKRLIIYEKVVRNETYSIEIHEWVDVKYGIPVKVKLIVNGYVLNIELKTFGIRKISGVSAVPT